MIVKDTRAEHLGLVETQLRALNGNLPMLWVTGQAHYATPGFAFIVIHGVDEDTPRRRSIRAEACRLLEKLGHPVAVQPGRDVFHIEPVRPTSRHEAVDMLTELSSLLE